MVAIFKTGEKLDKDYKTVLATHLGIKWMDLEPGAQEEILEHLAIQFMERAKDGAIPYGEKEIMSWEEKYMRTFAIDYRTWEDWKPGEKEDWYDWSAELKNHFLEKAEAAAIKWFARTEIEIQF